MTPRVICTLWVICICAWHAIGAQAHTPYAASAEHAGPAWFVDVAQQADITARNVNGSATDKRYIVEATGSGVAILDYDHDGWPDIFLVNGMGLGGNAGEESRPTSHLYRNNHDGTFADVTAGAGLEQNHNDCAQRRGSGCGRSLSNGLVNDCSPGYTYCDSAVTATAWGQGACVGDYDNDGYDDLYVTAYGVNRLYHNERNGTFREVAAQAGVSGSGKEWGTGCAFVDYDRDGRLDLVVANYVHFNLEKTPVPGGEGGCVWKGAPVMCGPRGLASAPNLLFHNDGGGHFSDVSAASGITKTQGHYCFSVTTLDYDEDGWPDIYIACDSTPSILYRNNHNGTFTDTAAESGVAFNEDGREQAGMGSTAADYDRDGHFDLFKTNFSDDTSTLYHANGDGTFTDATFAAGLGVNTDALGWGAMFMDVDNDGWPDILVANGHVYPEVDQAKLGATYREPRFLYWNSGDGKFKDISKASGPGLTQPMPARGLAIADLWNDGRQEVVINNLSDRPMLLVNEAKSINHWVELHLVGTRSNRSAIGACVRLESQTEGRPRIYVDEVRSGSSYNSSSDLRIHFGLGAKAALSSLTVRWPNGELEKFPPPPVDAITTIIEGSGTAAK